MSRVVIITEGHICHYAGGQCFSVCDREVGELLPEFDGILPAAFRVLDTLCRRKRSKRLLEELGLAVSLDRIQRIIEQGETVTAEDRIRWVKEDSEDDTQLLEPLP